MGAGPKVDHSKMCQGAVSCAVIIAQIIDPIGMGRASLGAYDAQLAIASALGRRSSQQMLPLALRDAKAGTTACWQLWCSRCANTSASSALAVEVASGQGPHRRTTAHAQAKDSLFGDALNFPFPMIGDALGLVDLGEAFRAPLEIASGWVLK